MNMNPPVLLAGLALVILGAVASAMLVLPIPPANAQSVTFVLGVIGGALTLQGGARPPNPPAI